MIRKLAAYVILGINTEGKKEVLSINVGDNESAKYWLSVMNELKNRGVKDVLIICADGLSGIKEAIAAAFPKTEYQRCIVHQVRNTLKYVPDKDRKAFATDMKILCMRDDYQNKCIDLYLKLTYGIKGFNALDYPQSLTKVAVQADLCQTK